MLFRKDTKSIQNILIVEDEPLVAFENEVRLAEAGYKIVATLDNAAEAIAVLRNREVDFVLADIKLRQGSGVDVAIVANELDVPVLFATGNCAADSQHYALGCLNKPYSDRELLRAIQIIDRLIQGEDVSEQPEHLVLYRAA